MWVKSVYGNWMNLISWMWPTWLIGVHLTDIKSHSAEGVCFHLLITLSQTQCYTQRGRLTHSLVLSKHFIFSAMKAMRICFNYSKKGSSVSLPALFYNSRLTDCEGGHFKRIGKRSSSFTCNVKYEYNSFFVTGKGVKRWTGLSSCTL